MKPLLPALAFALLQLCTPTLAFALPPVDQEAYEESRNEVIPDLVERLEAAAKACQKCKALRERNDLYAAILELDPDHALARKVLKYTKDRKTDEWVRKRKLKDPKATKPEAALEARAIMTEAATPYVDAITELLSTHAEDLEPIYTYGELAFGLRIAPDHLALRERLGYVRDDEGSPWQLKEVALTGRRRAHIAARIDELRKDIDDLKASELEDDEASWGIEFQEPIGTKHVRVVADGDYPEREDVVREIEVAWRLLHEITGQKEKKLRGLDVYLLANEDVAEALVDASSRWDKKAKEGAKFTLQRFDAYRYGNDFILSYRDRSEHRLDAALSEAVGAFLFKNFRLYSYQGWATTGMRHYTTELLLGTRMTFPSGANVSLEMQKRAREGELADWNVKARDFMADRGPKFLSNLVRRYSTSMVDDHVMVCYAFVGYILEGHDPEVIGKLLKKLVKEDAVDDVKVLEEHLGLPIEVIQARFTQWLQATAEPAVAAEAAAKR